MSINVSSNFLLGTGLPLDARTVVATTVARDAIPSVERYDGLSVYVTATSTTYQLQGGITNGDWQVFGGDVSGTGGANQVALWNETSTLTGDNNFAYDNTSAPGNVLVNLNGALSISGTTAGGVGPTQAFTTNLNYTPQVGFSTSVSGFDTNITVNDNGSDSNTNYYGANFNIDASNFTHHSNGFLQGMALDVNCGGNGSVIQAAYGFQGVINIESATATVNQGIGSEIVFQSIIPGGNFVQCIDYHVRDISGTSIAGTHYGMYVEDLTRGGANYGIWINEYIKPMVAELFTLMQVD